MAHEHEDKMYEVEADIEDLQHKVSHFRSALAQKTSSSLSRTTIAQAAKTIEDLQRKVTQLKSASAQKTSSSLNRTIVAQAANLSSKGNETTAANTSNFNM